ncbi:MAG: hypothetical protein NVS3B20_17010 [Polyangiales bacterium]
MLSLALAAVINLVPGPQPKPQPEPKGIFEAPREGEELRYRTFLSPGATLLGWHSLSGLGDASGAGLELSLVRWVTDEIYLGTLAQFERIDRVRAGVGVEAGYKFIGAELSCVREFAMPNGPRAQWSLQVAPFASLGMVYLSPRFLLSLNQRNQRNQATPNEADIPGSGVMFVVGVKFPVPLGG